MTSPTPMPRPTPTQAQASTPAPPRKTVSRRKSWSLDAIRSILNGTSNEDANSRDPKGLVAPTAAAMLAAETADRLVPLLSLLDPPREGEVNQMKVLLDLVEAIAAGLTRVESKLDALVSPPAAKAPRSPKR